MFHIGVHGSPTGPGGVAAWETGHTCSRAAMPFVWLVLVIYDRKVLVRVLFRFQIFLFSFYYIKFLDI